MKNVSKLFKEVFLLVSLFIICNAASAQLAGEFVAFNDGHCYFRATNMFNTSGVVRIRAISYYNNVSNEENVFIAGYGDGFILGPSTPWRWYWHSGDRIYVTYPDGSSTYWECIWNDPIYYSYDSHEKENGQAQWEGLAMMGCSFSTTKEED